MLEDVELSVGLSEDYCVCGHVASRHADGDGACGECRGSAVWGRTTRCPRFMWNETWQERRTA